MRQKVLTCRAHPKVTMVRHCRHSECMWAHCPEPRCPQIYDADESRWLGDA